MFDLTPIFAALNQLFVVCNFICVCFIMLVTFLIYLPIAWKMIRDVRESK